MPKGQSLFDVTFFCIAPASFYRCIDGGGNADEPASLMRRKQTVPSNLIRSPAFVKSETERTAEFPSLEKAIAASESAAYEKTLKALGDGVVRDFRIVEGLE
jgi:hypothetical protein